jgi:TolB-like protein/Tfp pilus assembly protein PilF
MNPGSFFAELKRRSVYKVATAYVVVAWLLIQVATQTFPFFEVPNWAIRFVILLLVLGFPVAVIIAWAFELTPEGIKRTEDAVVAAPAKRAGGRAWIVIVVAAGLLSAALFFLGRYTVGPRPDAKAVADKSIAVLPFENRSEDKANSYFADGIQDEILTRLAKIDDLKVISRTSTQRYKSSPENLPEIAKQLGVAHVLEGSVQKAGDQVRVNVQLIHAQTDAHLWAEVYDRKVADILAVQSEIAETIAKALQVKLSTRERKAVAAKPTESPEAYDAYLRGLAVWMGLDLSPKARREMEEHYTRAVQLDPKFALAWAYLSVVHTLNYAEGEPTAERLALAKRAVDTAFELQPTLGDAHFALGLYRYRALRHYDAALEAFDDAIQYGVHKALSLEFSSYVKRRQGKWDEALALNTESQQLDPRNAIIWSERAVTLNSLRRYAEARAAVDRALVISPDSGVLHAQKARTYQAEGNFEAAEQLLQKVPPDPQQPELLTSHFTQKICTRRFAEMISVLEGALAAAESLPSSLVTGYRLRLGFLRQQAGQTEEARRDLLQVRTEIGALLVRSDKDDASVSELIFVNGLLGDREGLEAGVAGLRPEILRDHFQGPEVEELVAAAWAQIGDKDAAFAILKRLAGKPGSLSIGTLRASPLWDPLRDDARFAHLLTELTP